MVAALRRHGRSDALDNIHITGWAAQDYRLIAKQYIQHGKFGNVFHTGVGSQNVTREARVASHLGLPVGEFDLRLAVFQALLLDITDVCRANGDITVPPALHKFVAHAKTWKSCCAEYYGVGEADMKPIFNRLYMDGSIRLGKETSSSRQSDVLPCVVDLQLAALSEPFHQTFQPELYFFIANVLCFRAFSFLLVRVASAH